MRRLVLVLVLAGVVASKGAVAASSDQATPLRKRWTPFGRQVLGSVSRHSGPGAALSRRGGFLLAALPQRLGTLGMAVASMAGMNGLGLIVSLVTRSHLHLDLLGSGAFFVTAVASFRQAPQPVFSSTRAELATSLVAGWSLRLASFLFYRILQSGHDARLDDLLANPAGMATFWGLSYVWGQLTLLPHTLSLAGAGQDGLKPPPKLKAWGFVWAALAALGIIVEGVADWSKFIFKQDPANAGRFCNVGLWRISQHPNYAGNLMVWFGVFGLCLPGIWAQDESNRLRQCARTAAAILSPLFISSLLYGQAKGSIGNAVELATAKWGDDPVWVEYANNTPLIFPFLG